MPSSLVMLAVRLSANFVTSESSDESLTMSEVSYAFWEASSVFLEVSLVFTDDNGDDVPAEHLDIRSKG